LISRILVDTGLIVAILSDSDPYHKACVEALSHMRGRLMTCWPVITEAAWLLRKYPHAVERLPASCNGGPFELLPLDGADLAGITAMMNKYRNLGLQLADACLAHLAEREATNLIFTLDRRDFSALRLVRGRKLRLIP
jgi:predicted nucleic acid-binding protein